MAVADHLNTVQKIYIAFYQRPADPAGLKYWAQRLEVAGGDLTAIIDAFAGEPEAQELYGAIDEASIGAVVDAIYQALFNRAPDAAGKQFYVDGFKAGTFSAGNIALNVLNGAQNDDLVAINNKVGVANEFSAQVDGRALTDAGFGTGTSFDVTYSGAADATAARDLLKAVTSNPATVLSAGAVTEALQSKIADAGDAIGGAVSGKTFVLTKGLDNVPGTSGNDTIIGSVDSGNPELNTMSPIDVVNGGAGVDTFKISAATALATADLASISNVEIIEVSGANTVAVDTSAIAGVTNLNVIKAVGAISAAAAATTDISVALKDAAAIGTVAAAGGKDVNVTLTDAQSTVNVGVGAAADAAGTVTVNATGAAVTNAAATTLGAINVTGGKSISVTQATGDTSGLVAGGGLQTQAQGAVTVIGNATTTDVTVKQTAEIGAVNGVATVAAVTETASVKFAAMTAGQTLTAAGLTFTAAKNLTKEEVATAFSNLINGTVPVAGDTQGSGVVANGVYTNAITGWTSGAANGDTVVFTSTALPAAAAVADLAFTGTAAAGVTVTTVQGVNSAGTAARLGVTAGAVSITDSNATIKTITIDGVGAAGASTTTTSVLETLNLSNVAAAATVTVADTAAALALNLEKVGTSAGDAAVTITTAPATLNVKSTGANYVDLTANATETLNVSGTGVFKADLAGTPTLKSIVVTESAGLNLGGVGAAGSLTSVDTTGTTGTVTVSIDGQKATYTGGAGVDNVTLTTVAPTKAINTGAGNDKVTLFSGTTAMGANGSIAGGDGTDTLVMVAADAVTASGGTTFATKVTGFERLEVTGATGAQAIDAAALGNYNDVTVATAAASTGLTLNNLTSGATIRLNDGTNISTTAAIKDADTNTADVLNIVVTDGVRGGAANNNGTIVAAEVETINISTVDGVTETPTNLAADQQNLTLQATKATKIVVTGDTALNLTNTGNIKVAEIDGSAMTAALTVRAAGNTATTIKGGSGNDVLTASATGSGNVAQVSTLTFTDGAGAAAMAAGDSIAVTINGTTVTQAFTTSFANTLDLLAAQIQDIGGDSVTYTTGDTAVAGVITITAVAAGTPFTVNTVFTPAAASSVTGVYAEGTLDQVLDVDTVTFGDTDMGAGDDFTITLTPDVGAVSTLVVPFNTSFAQTVADVATAITGAGYGVAVDTTNPAAPIITITAAAGMGAVATTAAFNSAGVTSATATASEALIDFVADADTLTFTEVTAMGANDTITISVTNGVDTYTTAAVAFNTDYATTLTDVATAVAGLNGGASFNAAVVGSVLTVTDKVAGGSPITNIGLTFTNAANNSVSSAFTTTTENVTVTAVADKLFGGAGNDTLVNNAGLSELTGGEGNDLFVISTAGTNVNSYSTIMDFTAGDLLEMNGAVAFKSAKVDLGSTAVFQDLANAAINALDTNEAGWFQFGTDTYVVMEVGVGASATTFENGTDYIVKLTGLVDLTNASFNATESTIGLI